MSVINNGGACVYRLFYTASPIMFKMMQIWKDWFDTEAPEDVPIPDGYSTSLNTFHKLLLIRSWCPDRTIPMAKVYVAEVMGKQVG